MTIKAEQVQVAGECLEHLRLVDVAIHRLLQMDDDPLANLIGQIGLSCEHSLMPSLSPTAARQIRALMRTDYQAQRAKMKARLAELGVELETK